MIGSWVLVTPPAEEPVTLTEIKDHLHISSTAEDSLLTLYAQMAREAVEGECWRALMPQTWDLHLPGWPAGGVIWIPRPPLRSITSITYRDEDGTAATFAAANYRVDTAAGQAGWVLAPGADWPSVALDSSNPITVRFVAGYADAGDARHGEGSDPPPDRRDLRQPGGGDRRIHAAGDAGGAACVESAERCGTDGDAADTFDQADSTSLGSDGPRTRAFGRSSPTTSATNTTGSSYRKLRWVGSAIDSTTTPYRALIAAVLPHFKVGPAARQVANCHGELLRAGHFCGGTAYLVYINAGPRRCSARAAPSRPARTMICASRSTARRSAAACSIWRHAQR